jgi:hypothetical protein
MKTPTKQPAKGGAPLPPGARMVPGSVAYEKAKGSAIKKPVTIDNSFVSDPRGGPELKAPHGVEVRDNRTKVSR